MQTSEYIIAYQTVSSSAYRRLRETLLQQANAFDSVEQANTFVLMRSAALDVLLTATQINDSEQARGEQARGEQARGEQVAGTPVKGEQASHLTDRKSMGVKQVNVSPEMAPEGSDEYRVGLTFDQQAIAVFTQKLNPEQLRSSQLRSSQLRPKPPHYGEHSSSQDFPPVDGVERGALQRNAIYRNPHISVSREDRLMAQKNFVLGWAKGLAVSPEGDTQPTQTALDNQLQQSLLLDQVITRIRHSLDLPAILETTVAQVREFLSADRLVLYQFDQFELTGQLAEQFAEEIADQKPGTENWSNQHSMPAANLDWPSGDWPSGGRQAGDQQIGDQQAGGQQAPESGPSAQVSAQSGQLQSGQLVIDAHASSERSPKIGRSVYSGHVTYESRVSDDIPTVLHLTEKECFSTSHSQRHARYLLGQPIAIDNVDEAYSDVTCLLDFLHQANVKSKIIAPILVQDRVWGLLVAHQCHTYRHWEKSEAIFLQHIAEHLAVAISQASLYQQLRQQTVSLESCVIERTQSLHDALMAAESANITKDEFLSTMSHELRTPLTYIIGMSATLLRWSLGDLNERQRSYIKTINQSGEQLLKVINDILEFASVESGRSLLNAKNLLLKTFIEQAIAGHQPMANKQEVALHLSFETDDSYTIEADEKRLRQIIGNLVHNAIKFTGAGGEVKVRVWRDHQFAVFQIEDTGIGIPESQRDDLFQKFKQLESPFQRQYSGTGLGLAMTKRLVELHGGTIQVHSQVAEGSTFTVRLPANSQVSGLARKQSKPLEQALETTPKRVILLEEDEDNAAIACEMLTAAGYEMIWLVESDQLADQLSSLKPALLIADLSILSPDLGNLKAIQHTITALNTKVLAISTEQTFDRSAMAHHDILHKPIDPKVLLSKVKQLA